MIAAREGEAALYLTEERRIARSAGLWGEEDVGSAFDVAVLREKISVVEQYLN